MPSTLAERGLGSTAPNPLVGCVIVADGRIVGEGFHPRAGEPHAEVFALRDAGDSARGATAYVTLEPCNHHGRTPPCSEALIAAGVARVVVGMRDPNELSAGGVERLRSAGIQVDLAADPGPFAALNEGWLKRMASGMPFITAKLGLSLDAHGAFAAGERAAITGPSGAEVTRLLRSQADAVVVSASTVIADDPALTVRAADGSLDARQPLRVVLVRETLPPQTAALFTDGLAETIVLVAGDGPAGLGDSYAGVEVLRSASEDLRECLRGPRRARAVRGAAGARAAAVLGSVGERRARPARDRDGGRVRGCRGACDLSRRAGSRRARRWCRG